MTPGRLHYGFAADTVFDPQPPIAGESLLSWIARTSTENELPHMTTIMREVGQAHRNRMVDVLRNDIDVAGLATVLGCDIGEVTIRRGQNVEDGRVRYMGALIRPGDLHSNARRFSPASLTGNVIPHYRASWLIRTFPVCPVGWQVLRRACDCGTEQTWATVGTMTLCDGCGGDLRELAAEHIPPDLRPGLRLLADILFGEPEDRDRAMATLPPALRSLDPGEVFEVALLVTRIVDPRMANPRKNVWRDEPARLARALSKAGDLLSRWPETPWLALDAAGDPRTMHPRCHALKSLHRVLTLEFGRDVAPLIADDLERMRRRITLDEADPPADLVDLNDAERIARVPKKKIRAARAGGHLRCLFVIRRGEILPGYDRAELEALATTADWPSAATVGKRVGVPAYGIEQVCAMDGLGWAKAPIRTLRNGFRVDPRDVDALERDLRSAASPLAELSDPVPLTTVLRGIGGREKPWGPVLQALRKRELRYAVGRSGRAAGELFVDLADAHRIRSMVFDADEWPSFPFSDVVNQNDACDILNVPCSSRQLVGPHRIGKRRGAWLFSRMQVRALAESVVTSTELCARHYLKPKTGGAAIRRARLNHHVFGFERRSALLSLDAAVR